tara:strand:+ start:12241 stop:12735 length:495 start_codon:yes stop_codon:yes gene_type:complete
MIRFLRDIYYVFHQLIYLRKLRDGVVLVDLDFTLFDNLDLIKNFPNEDFYSINMKLNSMIKKELNLFSKDDIYLFTARGIFNSSKTFRQLKILDFNNYNDIFFLGKTEYKFSFLKINDIFFKKKIIVYDDFQDYNSKEAKIIPKSPPNLIYTRHINPLNIKKNV